MDMDIDSESSSTDDDTLEIDFLQHLSEKEKQALHNNNLESLDQSECVSLCVEFKEISKMEFLRDFTSLVRLDLNNNLIEKIWGLDHLTNLTWLNLSLNRIKNIEGLESLRKLQLLNLSNNQISLLENMDTLENLSHFFISKNLIRQKEAVLYLRRFKNLFKLSIAGNPFNEKDNHSFYIAAFLPNVRLLENILIGQKLREEASIKYQDELKELGVQESQEQQHANGFEQHQDAFVDNTVMKGNAESIKPQCLPGVAPALQTFKSQMTELCSQKFAIGSAEHQQMEAELNSFICGQLETKAYYQQRVAQILGEFEEQQTQRRVTIKRLEDPEVKKIQINNCMDEISQLYKSLFTLEFELIGNLDVRLHEILFVYEIIYFSLCCCVFLYQDNIKQFDSYLSDMLFTSNDSAGHDDPLETTDDAEIQMVTQVNDLKAALINKIQEKEEKRNRMRISEIQQYVDYLRKQLEDFIAPEASP
ncbi:dynein regulatory complex subunit 3 [Fundulus heteroclitus]|uniref:dynein regulatory complex subunit 3 n=1 Tax=Fundulus heteroclitus TaxID=8078 RepID=UPI00165A9DE6|nr:dynein regulatory complex subunit 3 [Fundulus heteroclitus]